MNAVKFKNGALETAGNLHFPAGFDEEKRYPAIVCCHPAGGVKEQTSGVYASKLAAEGFVTIAFDASYQGESGGEPRYLENPYARVEDISAALDYLTTLPYVDRDRIGAMGICAGAAYTVTAALGDRRIKAVGAVSAANYGAVLRNGWDGRSNFDQAFAMLEAAVKRRKRMAPRWAASRSRRKHGRGNRRRFRGGLRLLPYAACAVRHGPEYRTDPQPYATRYLRCIPSGEPFPDAADPDRCGRECRYTLDERRPLPARGCQGQEPAHRRGRLACRPVRQARSGRRGHVQVGALLQG
jgi:Dienelactone hydrolase family